MRPFNAVARTEITNDLDKLRKSVLLMETTDELKTLHGNIVKAEVAKAESRVTRSDFWTISAISFVCGATFEALIYRLNNGVWF